MLSLATFLGGWVVVTALAGLVWALQAWYRTPTASGPLLRDGHTVIAGVEYKRCTSCRLYRAVSKFYADEKGNLFYRCRPCVASERLAKVPRPERVVVVDSLSVATPSTLSGDAWAPPPSAAAPASHSPGGLTVSLHSGATGSAGRRGPGYIPTSPHATAAASDSSSALRRTAAQSPSLGPSSSSSSPPASVGSKVSVPRPHRMRGDPTGGPAAPQPARAVALPGALCDPSPGRLAATHSLVPSAILVDRLLLESRTADKEHFTREWLEGLAC